jgi:hypothetical protein
VYKDSPAVALGSYALNGWSSDDTKREDSGVFPGSKAYVAIRHLGHAEFARSLAICAVMVGNIAVAIWCGIHAWNVSADNAYRAYYAEHTKGKDVITITRSQMVTLPRGEPLYYLGALTSSTSLLSFSTNRSIDWRVSPHQQPQIGNWYSASIRESAPHTYYGTAELGALMGIPAKINVLYADKEKVQFTIDYYIK